MKFNRLLTISILILLGLVFIVGANPHPEAFAMNTKIPNGVYSVDKTNNQIIKSYNKLAEIPFTKKIIKTGSYKFSSVITLDTKTKITINHETSFTTIYIKKTDKDDSDIYKVYRDLVLSNCKNTNQASIDSIWKKLSTGKYFRNVNPDTRIETKDLWVTYIIRPQDDGTNYYELELRLLNVF